MCVYCGTQNDAALVYPGALCRGCEQVVVEAASIGYVFRILKLLTNLFVP